MKPFQIDLNANHGIDIPLEDFLCLKVLLDIYLGSVEDLAKQYGVHPDVIMTAMAHFLMD